MAEPSQFTFSYQEIAEVLIKHEDIHEGLWGVYFEFALGAGTVPAASGDGNVPAAVVPLQRMGLQKFDQEVKGLTVDAAAVNPVSAA